MLRRLGGDCAKAAMIDAMSTTESHTTSPVLTCGVLAGNIVRLEPLTPEHVPGLQLAAEAAATSPFATVPTPETVEDYVDRSLARRDTGTYAPFAQVEVATGRVTAACKPRHRSTELLVFLRQVTRAHPDDELHLVMDNYAAHKRVEVRNWLTANPRIKVHFTPTSGSWLNLVEVWFGIIERQAIRRGTFVSVRELIGKIREFINSWNNRKHPFIWTKTPDEILAKINRKRKHTSTPRH